MKGNSHVRFLVRGGGGGNAAPLPDKSIVVVDCALVAAGYGFSARAADATNALRLPLAFTLVMSMEKEALLAR